METTHTNALHNQEFLNKVKEVVSFFSRKKGFGLLFCTSSNFYLRKEVNKQVAEKLASKGIEVKDILVEDEENFTPFYDQFNQHLKDHPKLSGLIINNLDYLIAEYPDALYTFNQSRDIITQLETLLMVWIKKEDIARWATSAQDIFSFRTISTIEFPDIEIYHSSSTLESRFSEDYQTKEEYEQIKLKIELYERQLKEAEESGYPIHKTITELVLPLYRSYQDIQISDKTNELYVRYEKHLKEDNIRHLELKFRYLSDNRMWDEAIEVAEKIIKIAKETDEKEKLATTLNNVSLVFQDKGQYKTALDYQLRTIEIYEQTFENKLLIIIYYNNVANSYKQLGYLKNALEFHLKIINILEKIFDDKHPKLATSYNNIAAVYQDLKELEKALEFNLKAISIREQIFDNKHPDLAGSYNNIALVYHNLGRLKKSLEFNLKTINIFEQIFDNKHPNLATSYNNIAGIFQELKDFKKALEFNLKAINIREKIFDNKHPDIASSYNNIANIYYKLGQKQKALDYQKKAMTIMEYPQNRNLPLYQTIKQYFDFYQSQMPVLVQKVGRNEPCICGSGKKYKKCCGRN